MTKQRELTVGEIVRLKSGGPEMTVHSRVDHSLGVSGNYTCQWFAGKKLERGVFPRESLEVVGAGEE